MKDKRQWTFKPSGYNITSGVVAGQWYRVTVFTGATFDFWVPGKLERHQAKHAAWDYIGKEVYDWSDIVSVRAIKEYAA